MKNIRKKQIKNLFKYNFINVLYHGIWFSGIKGYGKYKEWYYNGQIYIEANFNKKGELNNIYKEWDSNRNFIFEIEFKDNELIGINYVNFKYDESWFNYYDQIQDKQINFYDKIKEMYNSEKYKKRTN